MCCGVMFAILFVALLMASVLVSGDMLGARSEALISLSFRTLVGDSFTWRVFTKVVGRYQKASHLVLFLLRSRLEFKRELGGRIGQDTNSGRLHAICGMREDIQNSR